jgi:hypothetical protein
MARPSVSVPVASCWLLSLLLALAAGAKLLTSYQDSYVVPAALYYLGAVVELGVAVLLHTRWRRVALALAALLAVAGIALAAVVPGRLCGCLGSLLPLDGKGHVLLSGIVGALACLGARSGARVVAADAGARCEG